MTVDQIEALITRWIDTTLEEQEDHRATCGPVSESYRENQLDGLSIALDDTEEMLMGCDYRRIAREADELLVAAGLPLLNHDGAAFGRLCRRLLIGKQEVYRIETNRWEGNYGYNGYAPRAAAGRVPTDTADHRADSAPQATAATGPLFSVVAEKFTAENPRTARTAKPLKAELQKFIETIGGDRPIASITKADARTYKEVLLNSRKLSVLTVVKHLSGLATLWRWAEQQGYVADGVNPIKGLAPTNRQVRKQALKRRPFTDEELVLVLGSNEFQTQRETNPARYWVVLICLFQVCRREVAGQLALKDIQEQDGIWFFDITDKGKDQGLKNDGSR